MRGYDFSIRNRYNHVHPAAQETLQFVLQATQVKKASAHLHFHDEINVALDIILTAGHRTKYADFARPIPGTDGAEIHLSSPEPLALRSPLSPLAVPEGCYSVGERPNNYAPNHLRVGSQDAALVSRFAY